MKTEFIGLKEFKQNITKYQALTAEGKVRLIVLKKNVPIMEVKMIDPEDYIYLNMKEEIEKSAKQIKNGEFFTHEEVLSMLNLK
jgi:PHD/YefM family antitoxin component YafN of YafNO toxin-antitoxin module